MGRWVAAGTLLRFLGAYLTTGGLQYAAQGRSVGVPDLFLDKRANYTRFNGRRSLCMCPDCAQFIWANVHLLLELNEQRMQKPYSDVQDLNWPSQTKANPDAWS